MSEMRTRLGALVELVRPPNVFTAVADSLAGLILLRAGFPEVADRGLWCLAASACLYLGGMALNDYFDREQDARERPERPIPSGRLSAGVAGAVGFGFLGAGVVFAGLAGLPSLLVALVLAATIVLYDAVLKESVAGFIGMGVNRFLNFSMPMALGVATLPSHVWLGPLLLGAYVTVVTFLSTAEVFGAEQKRARGAVVGMAVVLAALAWTVVSHQTSLVAWILLAAVLIRAFDLYRPLWNDFRAPTVGRAIGGSILTIPLFDGTLVAAAGYDGPGVLVAALTLPGLWLRRLYSPT